ncbi:transglutaminase domain-containing protein [Bacillus dakarensis]|uniref:transglutaminase domain-containing protein n=1 Tax=Robertmurraya dakarensis TaxID=1926278 RepID=UPI000A03B6D9|nr:transglutaminase domain-containing protein [Bacillus dakarensis]
MMKRYIWLWAVMFFCVLPIHGYAEESYQIHAEWTNHMADGSSSIQASSIKAAPSFQSQSLDGLAAEIEKALLKRETVFTITYEGDTTDLKGKINEALETVLLRNEYLSYDYRGLSYYGDVSSQWATLTFSARYYQTAEQKAYVDKRIPQILNEIIKEDMNTHEKVKAVHDYIVLNVEYDESYNQGVNAPYFALTEGTTLCNGYAMLVYQMLQELNIPVRLISGTAGDIGHAWNLVQLDGKWYHLDATWDDPVPDEKGRTVYNYYLVPDKMIANDHHWQEGGLNGHDLLYPTAQTDYAQVLSALGYEELAKSLDLHFLDDEYTTSTDEEVIKLVSAYLDKMDYEFSFRYVTNDVNYKEKLGNLIREAAGQTYTKSWSYSVVDYPRSEEKDYIVTVSDIEYLREISGIGMAMLPKSPLKSGEESPFLLYAELSNGMRLDVTMEAEYSIDHPEVAEIRKGIITAKNPGTTTIVASYRGKTTSFSIEVEKGPEEIPYPMEGYKHFGEQTNVDSDKVWNVKFNTDLSSYLGDADVYVLNRFGEKGIQFIEHGDSQTIKVHPPLGGYIAGETYYLVIEKNLQSAKGDYLKEAVTFKFTIEK